MPTRPPARRASTRRWATTLLALALAATAGRASASPGSSAPADMASALVPPVHAVDLREPCAIAAACESRWYGWQIMLADAASIAAITFTLDSHRPGDGLGPVYGAYFGGYGLAGPAIHLAHGHGGAMGRSLLLRLVLPFAGAAGGAALGGRGWDALGGALLGLMGGMGTAMVTDWVTAYDRVPVDSGAQEAPTAALPAAQPGDWAPLVIPQRGGATVAVAVAF